ncbi:serine O-acetyltransferase [Spirosoma pollinicola]|uniref:Serine acetyltransferase n=1 Tax=Spirosoma pollinicola TaxID=2057025 RepID=A0A2K8ZCM5_9BACT|nr:DapH/DapD/GlmU-related protein [Spirosoma pollinicola]AUD07625.1 serine acetyltransferase [Spirosoma pollinicola]
MSLINEVFFLKSNTKGLLFIVAFRVSAFFSKNFFLKIVGFPIRTVYKISVQWVLGIDISDTTIIGENFNVFHGHGLVINRQTVIGNNVTVRQNTTVGSAKDNGKSPVIGNNVNIGANSVVIGNITIGDNSLIAAGSVVLKDVPSNTVVAGNPAVVIKIMKVNE